MRRECHADGDSYSDRLDEYCRRWKIAELRVFGSAVRDDFRPDSDLDLLVTFGPDAEWSLLDHVAMEEELLPNGACRDSVDDAFSGRNAA